MSGIDFQWPPTMLLDQFKDQRELRDLLAQEAMADWAFWMLVTTAIGTALGLLSVYFIFRTFRQTQDALEQARLTNQHAKETAFIENRPWILINEPAFFFTVVDTTEDEISMALSGTFRIVNNGKMPAIGVEYDVVLTQDTEVIKREWKSKPTAGRGGKIILPPGLDTVFTVGDYLYKIRRGATEPDLRLIEVLVRVSYNDLIDPLRSLKSVGHGCLAEPAPGGGNSFQPIIYEKVVSYGLPNSSIYGYSIKFMI